MLWLLLSHLLFDIFEIFLLLFFHIFSILIFTILLLIIFLYLHLFLCLTLTLCNIIFLFLLNNLLKFLVLFLIIFENNLIWFDNTILLNFSISHFFVKLFHSLDVWGFLLLLSEITDMLSFWLYNSSILLEHMFVYLFMNFNQMR